MPGKDLAELARLPIGRRDALLLDLRGRTFGPNIDVFLECEECGERLELSLPAASLAGECPLGPGDTADLEVDGYRATFRLPDSLDLAAALHAGQNAPRVLALRTVLSAEKDGLPIPAADLPDSVVAALGERAAELDPASEIVLAPLCPACGARASVPFDIGAHLWAEVRFHARRLLVDIHQLARAYGWSEAEILSLSPARRRAYLEILGA